MKKYNIIYSDPPWRFTSGGAKSGMFTELGYRTMSIKELCELPVKNHVMDNAVLFMWSTSAHIPFVSPVMEAWGFKYVRVEAVWEKVTKNGKKAAACGPWGLNEAEYLFMGVRGRMHNMVVGKSSYTIASVPRVCDTNGKPIHSAKPGLFRFRIENKFKTFDSIHMPNGQVKLELFARRRVSGWDVFGDQVEGSITL